jgi:hypothetical protein
MMHRTMGTRSATYKIVLDKGGLRLLDRHHQRRMIGRCLVVIVSRVSLMCCN